MKKSNNSSQHATGSKLVAVLIVLLIVSQVLIIRENLILHTKLDDLLIIEKEVKSAPKIAFVNVKAIFDQCRKRELEEKRINEKAKRFDSEWKEVREELKQMNAEIQALEKEIKESGGEWTEIRKEVKVQRLDRLITEALEKDNERLTAREEFQQKIRNEMNTVTKSLFEEIQKVAQRKGRVAGFDVVVNSSAIIDKTVSVFIEHPNNEKLVDSILEELNEGLYLYSEESKPAIDLKSKTKEAEVVAEVDEKT